MKEKINWKKSRQKQRGNSGEIPGGNAGELKQIRKKFGETSMKKSRRKSRRKFRKKFRAAWQHIQEEIQAEFQEQIQAVIYVQEEMH